MAIPVEYQNSDFVDIEISAESSADIYETDPALAAGVTAARTAYETAAQSASDSAGKPCRVWSLLRLKTRYLGVHGRVSP
jgi:hypothetical protein